MDDLSGIKPQDPRREVSVVAPRKLAMLTLSIIDDLRSGSPLDLNKMSEAEVLASKILSVHSPVR